MLVTASILFPGRERKTVFGDGLWQILAWYYNPRP